MKSICWWVSTLAESADLPTPAMVIPIFGIIFLVLLVDVFIRRLITGE
jgi:hypothetical protein